MPKTMQVEGLEELRKRFSAFRGVYNKIIRTAIASSLLILWENIPAYPEALPESSYTRTGLLGRSLGVSMEGGRGGKPQVYQINEGTGYMRGSIGTRLRYAQDVIGPRGFQKRFFRERGWWRLDDITLPARPKIQAVFEKAVEKLAAFLDGKGVRL